MTNSDQDRAPDLRQPRPSLMLCWAAGTISTLAAITASAQINFEDQAVERGVIYVADDLETTEVGVAGQCQGGAFADLDRDGDDDIVLSGELGGAMGLFINEGTGNFTRITDSGLPLLDNASSVTAADYDMDGDLDLFIGQFNAANLLYRNEGGLTFTDVTVAAGLDDDGATTGTTWGDYDLDGDLDLYVGNYPNSYDASPSWLYRNNGDGTFEEVAESLGMGDPGGMTFQASFADYDLDGDVDLYKVNDRGSVGAMLGNRLWKNLGDGTFEDVSEATGAGLHMFSMGVAFGDVDNNGWPDYYVTNIEENALLIGNGLTFQERGLQWQVLGLTVSWGTVFFDCDNDSFLDIFVCNTPLSGVGTPAPILFECEGTSPCNDVAPQAGFDLDSEAFGVTSSDIDHDGDVDLLMVRPDLPVSLYVNQDSSSAHWLEVRLIGWPPQQDAVGATVFVNAGGKSQQRAVVFGSSFKSQLSADLHFGLDQTDFIDSVEVLWPGGDRTCLNQVPADQLIIIEQARAVDQPVAADDPSPMDGAYESGAVTELSWADGGDLIYDLYFGSTMPPPFLISTPSTSHALDELTPGTAYYWRIDTRACETTVGPSWQFSVADDADSNNNVGSSDDEPPADEGTPPPSVNILTPTTEADYVTEDSSITLSGSASDSVTSVLWSNDRGGGGPCTGVTSWTSGPIALFEGANRITITAMDAQGQPAADELTVTYQPAADGETDPIDDTRNDNDSGPEIDNVADDPGPGNVADEPADNTGEAVDQGNTNSADAVEEPDVSNPVRPADRPSGFACGAALIEVMFVGLALLLRRAGGSRL